MQDDDEVLGDDTLMMSDDDLDLEDTESLGDLKIEDEDDYDPDSRFT